MEPIQEDSGRYEPDGSSRRGTGGLRGSKGTQPFSTRRTERAHDIPSLKYPEINTIGKVALARAQSPPKPTLPRRSTRRTWNATAKERNPLVSSLTGGMRGPHMRNVLGIAS